MNAILLLVSFASGWAAQAGSAREGTLILYPHGAEVTVLLNGQPITGDEQGRYALALNEGANTVGLDCRGAGAWSPDVEWASGGLPAPFAEGWRVSLDPPADWTSPKTEVAAWPAAPARDSALSAPRTAARAVFRRTLYVSAVRERFWPMQADVNLPRRSQQRLYPLLGEAGVHVLPGFTYVLDLPHPLRVVAADRLHGSAMRITPRPATRRDGVEYHSYALTEDGPLGSGFQLLAHFSTDDGAVHTYKPVLDMGGTFDWQLLQGAATAPRWATKCGVLLLKWQNQGITGEGWFDDVTMKAQGEDRNLVPAGTFEEPLWTGKSFIEPCSRNGQTGRCVHFVATEANVSQQQGVWVTEPHVPVTPGRQYVFTVQAKATDVRVAGRQPRACLLVDAGSPRPSELTGYAHWEAEGGNTIEVERPFPIHVLSPLANKRPKSARFIACYYSDLLENEACERALARTTKQSGINGIFGSDETAVTRYWPGGKRPECIWPISWEGYDESPPAPDFLKQHPDLAAVQKNGQLATRFLCPTALLEEPNDFMPALKRWLVGALRNTRYGQVDWDHEFPVWEDSSICFDERCLKAFGRWAGLPETTVLTRESVIAEHKDEWIRFRCDQNARMAEKLGEWVKEADPKLVYSVYSGFQTPYTEERYGVDWTKMATRVDLGIAGYNGDRPTISETVSALACRPFIAGEMYHENDRTAQYPLPTPTRWRLRLLRDVLNDRGHGVLVWWLPVLDGGGFWGLSQVAALVHDFEPFFRRFDRRDELARATPALSPDSLAVLTHDDERLVICANGEADQVAVRIRNRHLPAGAVMRRWPGGDTVAAPRVLEATLDSEEIAVWWIGPEASPSQ